jgi:hypothetical protein
VAEVVDQHAEALNRAHTQQDEIARLGEDDLIGRLEASSGENRVANTSRP